MGNAIGQILAFGVGIAISPFPDHRRRPDLDDAEGPFQRPRLLGWILGLAAAGTLVLLIAGGADASTGGSNGWANVLKLILGLALIVLAVKQWRSRPGEGEEPPMPGWVKSIDQFTPGRVAGHRPDRLHRDRHLGHRVRHPSTYAASVKCAANRSRLLCRR